MSETLTVLLDGAAAGRLTRSPGGRLSFAYDDDYRPSPAQIVRLLRSAMRPTAAEDAVRRFADALAWNWLLLAGPETRLAPLYDIASALKLGGDYHVYPDHNPWPRTARELGIDAVTLTDRVRELALPWL